MIKQIKIQTIVLAVELLTLFCLWWWKFFTIPVGRSEWCDGSIYG